MGTVTQTNGFLQINNFKFACVFFHILFLYCGRMPGPLRFFNKRLTVENK